MREKAAGKIVSVSRSIQFFSGFCAFVILMLVFGFSYMENRLMNESASVLDCFGRLAEAQTQLVEMCLESEHCLIYEDLEALNRFRTQKERLTGLLEPIEQEVLSDSDSRFYYRTLHVMLGNYYENVSAAFGKENVYSIYFSPSLGIKKRGEALENQLSQLTTSYLQYRTMAYYAMLARMKQLSLWRNGIAGLLAVCISVFAYYRLRQGSGELKGVLVHAQDLAHGKWELPDLQMGHYKEINEIIATFNHMKKCICSYIEDINKKNQMEIMYTRERLLAVKREKEARDWQLRALQMQINPHFLFNTMNIISRTALLGKTEVTVLLVESI